MTRKLDERRDTYKRMFFHPATAVAYFVPPVSAHVNLKHLSSVWEAVINTNVLRMGVLSYTPMCCHTHQCAEHGSAVIHTNVLQIPPNLPNLQIKPCISKLSLTDCDCIDLPTDVDQPSLTCLLGHA